jgi:single-strand DNA-binding protein
MNNLVIITGRLGRDPEIRNTPSGKEVASFSIAVKGGTKDKPKTFWFDVTCWQDLATWVAKALHKGDEVTAIGRLEVEEYTNREQVSVKKTKIVANSIAWNPKHGSVTELVTESATDEDIPF